MALSPDVLSAEARVFAAALRSAPRDEHGVVHVSGDKASSLAHTLDQLAAIVDVVRNTRDFGPAVPSDGCATVIRCGETIRIVGPDGRGVFATINARMQETPPVDSPARMLKAVRRAMVKGLEHSPHAIRARGVDGALREVVQIPLGVWQEIEAAARAVEEGA